MVGEAWHEVFTERARAWWTKERLEDLLRGKRLLVTPDRAPCLLRAMGLLDADAHLPPNRVRKFRQINHMLSFLRPALDDLEGEKVDLVDAGCGRSALGFLVAWWLEQQGKRVRLLGIDFNDDVIQGCRERADMAGLRGLRFTTANLAEADLDGLWRQQFGDGADLDVLLALHACDTATDDALVLAVENGARLFAVAPCCQAELARSWKTFGNGGLAPVWSNPHFRRTTAATVTDAMRTELMRAAGYDVRAVEFVEAHHTPKNTLIYGHARGTAGERSAYDALVQATGGAGIGLADRL